MCGIVGYVGKRDAGPILMEGLHRLEYRGYDSAGIACARNNKLSVHKAKGKVRDLERQLPAQLKGTPGIAHTRWATHGEPSDRNAHPHCDGAGRFAIVHNGIIENAAQLRSKLQAGGVTFQSETDSEVLAHLIAAVPADKLEDSVRAALRLVTGTYGLAVLDAQRPESIVVARNGSPVVLGIGDREMFVASDPAALVRHTQSVVHLDDGEIAVVRADGFETSTLDGGPTAKTAATIAWTDESFDKSGYTHYMRKEIAEQAEAIRRTLSGRLDSRFQTTHLGGVEMAARELLEIRRVKILGCGSAYIAGCAGAHLIEQLARIPAHAEPASEFRYRNPVVEQDTLYIAVSQSGETFDTLAAVQEVKRKGGRVLGIVNVVGSTVARECGRGIYLHAGPEIAVVATKTFTSTVVALALLAIHLGRIRDMSTAHGARLLKALEALPAQVESILAQEPHIAALAAQIAKSSDAYFVGRAAGFPIAMEGALKLKEISYLHAEAYPASELKHGPLALISPETPTVVILPRDDLFTKNVSTIEEIRARSGPVYVVTHPGDALPMTVNGVIEVPKSEPELDALLLNIPLQLLAYHVALAKDRNIDQPRNLAKSVTVE
ncbi:MAG TPA: glutamine--fructose-6-phosphate transaminase (isomerizing) [Steroidobacteraceae bacterium]|jgi:glucosamine--fructose-6-phosphate aminotransferase (isomerizing)|nr:glutamine--fructose-6-phosphate transaminase (isomerizing) [Steroidobacteraceae bacterium]